MFNVADMNILLADIHNKRRKRIILADEEKTTTEDLMNKKVTVDDFKNILKSVLSSNKSLVSDASSNMNTFSTLTTAVDKFNEGTAEYVSALNTLEKFVNNLPEKTDEEKMLKQIMVDGLNSRKQKTNTDKILNLASKTYKKHGKFTTKTGLLSFLAPIFFALFTMSGNGFFVFGAAVSGLIALCNYITNEEKQGTEFYKMLINIIGQNDISTEEKIKKTKELNEEYQKRIDNDENGTFANFIKDTKNKLNSGIDRIDKNGKDFSEGYKKAMGLYDEK